MAELTKEIHGSTAVSNWRERHASSIRMLRLYARTFARNGSAMLGLGLVLLFLITAAIGPYVVPFPEDAAGSINIDRKLQPPDAVHWFGTDEVGNDVFTRVIVGARVTLLIACIVTGVAMLIGIPLGMIAGYMGGWVQEVIMRITDVFLSVPGLILAIAIVGALGPGIVNAMLALSLVFERDQLQSAVSGGWWFVGALLITVVLVNIFGHGVFYKLLQRYDATLIAPITLLAGAYRLCWCALNGRCSSPEDYRVDAGEMLLVGPVSTARTCVAGQTCSFRFEGLGIVAADEARQRSNSSAFCELQSRISCNLSGFVF